ncbi:MAG: biopolymer transporter ExbD [Bacteroidota bacterium]
MKFEQKHRVDPAFNYASLTDIVLQLLIFFVLVSSLMVMPGIKISLPDAVQSEKHSETQTVLTITNKGRLFLNRDEVQKENLAQKLISIIDKDREKVIIIRSDKEVSLQQAVEVMDIAKGVGAKKFLIATETIK